MNNYDEWKNLFEEEIEIKVLVKKIKSFIIPCSNGDFTVVFKMKKMTCQDHWNLEKKCNKIFKDKTKECEDGNPLEINYLDYQEFRKEMLCKMIKSVSFGKLKFKKSGSLSDKSKNYLLSLPAPLISYVLQEYEALTSISEEEEEKIVKQAIILFAKNSKGVENACEAVNLYCSIGNFWEKFGLNRFQLKELPYKEYMMLKMMISKENQSIASKNSASKSKGRNISLNGKTQRSNGIVIPDTGQLVH